MTSKYTSLTASDDFQCFSCGTSLKKLDIHLSYEPIKCYAYTADKHGNTVVYYEKINGIEYSVVCQKCKSNLRFPARLLKDYCKESLGRDDLYTKMVKEEESLKQFKTELQSKLDTDSIFREKAISKVLRFKKKKRNKFDIRKNDLDISISGSSMNVEYSISNFGFGQLSFDTKDNQLIINNELLSKKSIKMIMNHLIDHAILTCISENTEFLNKKNKLSATLDYWKMKLGEAIVSSNPLRAPKILKKINSIQGMIDKLNSLQDNK